MIWWFVVTGAILVLIWALITKKKGVDKGKKKVVGKSKDKGTKR